MDYAKSHFSGNIPHPALVTLLCIKGGVTFSEIEEEKCPKSSPLTLSGITKGPIENEKWERRRNRKITVEEPRELVPTIEAEEESDSEERWGFEAHSKQPMLSLATEEATLAHIITENRGKQRAKVEEKINYELLILLKEMKAKIKEKDEQTREELIWRDNHLHDQMMKREKDLAIALQQRNDEWREKVAERDRAIRAEFREKEKEFISEQLKRE